VSEIHGKSAGQNDTVKVKTTHGQVFEFDEVVVTCPLGWLKQNIQAFVPPLPDRLHKAIQNIGYGTLEKVSYASRCPVFRHNAKLDVRSTSHFPPPSGLMLLQTTAAQFRAFVNGLPRRTRRS
jgi:monoamine oxidase